ncbi:alpha/beta fold hydrolase [Lelliottia nimipressuralis]|uniref:alpha/beta fold hydrolase n=1 Tax=Lelliottia nimipressuralis TaxID=69220 RepID=UPI003D2C2BB1
METEFCLDGPEGAPLLMLSNSLGTTWAMWQAQLPALTPHFRVLRYNTRGHGRSAVGQQPVTLERLGQDVIALLDHLDVDRACFCGISLGGLTGMWLNCHAPERFHRIVVANTAARIGQEEGWRQRAARCARAGDVPRRRERSRPLVYTCVSPQQSGGGLSADRTARRDPSRGLRRLLRRAGRRRSAR